MALRSTASRTWCAARCRGLITGLCNAIKSWSLLACAKFECLCSVAAPGCFLLFKKSLLLDRAGLAIARQDTNRLGGWLSSGYQSVESNPAAAVTAAFVPRCSELASSVVVYTGGEKKSNA